MTATLQLLGVRRNFGRTEIIRGVDLEVSPGERVAVIGPNGAGKSTLFNLISGRLTPGSGHILLDGVRIDGKAPHQIYRLGLARSFQLSNLFANLSVLENLRCAALWSLGYGYSLWHRVAGLHDANQRATSLLQELGLQSRGDVPAADLSYAEQRALEVGLTVAGGARVILLDEPTSGMSAAETARFVALIRRITEGRTLVVIEHDMRVVFELADRIAVLAQGRVIALDAPAAIRADARVQEAYLGTPAATGHPL